MDRAKATRLLSLYRFRSGGLRRELEQCQDEHERELIEDEIEVLRMMASRTKQLIKPRSNSYQRRH